MNKLNDGLVHNYKRKRSGCIVVQTTANAGTFGSENIEFNPEQRSLIAVYQLARSLKQLREIIIRFSNEKVPENVFECRFCLRIKFKINLFLQSKEDVPKFIEYPFNHKKIKFNIELKSMFI